MELQTMIGKSLLDVLSFADPEEFVYIGGMAGFIWIGEAVDAIPAVKEFDKKYAKTKKRNYKKRLRDYGYERVGDYVPYVPMLGRPVEDIYRRKWEKPLGWIIIPEPHNEIGAYWSYDEVLNGVVKIDSKEYYNGNKGV